MSSIRNSIEHIDFIDKEKFKISLNKDNIYLVELDGKAIQSWKSYIIDIQNKFQLPTSCLDSIDRYLDWMRDLQWINEEEIVLIINNYNYFLRNDSKLKEELILDFEEELLPYWEKEVKNEVIDGVPRPFKVYLVD